MVHRLLRILLIVLTAFLALTAFAGGIGLVAGINAPSVEMLAGSPFGSYLVPGLSLFLVVGGVALVAALLLARRHPQSALVSGLSGIVIIGFELVEVLAIGSPPGIARDLQIFYISLGLLILVLSVARRLLRPEPRRAFHAQAT